MGDPAAVDLAHRNETGECAGAESLVRAINVIERELLLEDRDAVFLAQPDDGAASDAGDAILPARGPHLTASDDEEMGRIAGGDEAQRIEHQGLVGAGIHGLDASSD